jgi:hypothetical protein
MRVFLTRLLLAAAGMVGVERVVMRQGGEQQRCRREWYTEIQGRMRQGQGRGNSIWKAGQSAEFLPA